ncbi:MAG: hypothetical protein IEMM0006_1683 [bacterium]|nr:MAG: hypothetical protein IEMM0006_1683 [bacterium]
MGQAKKLYRTTYDKIIGGVAGGLSEYFDVDVVIFRLLFVLLVLLGGGGLVAYIIMWIVVPAQPIPLQYNKASGTQANPGSGGDADAGNPATGSERVASPDSPAKTLSNTSLVAGIILILVGVLFLANRMLPWFEMRDFWPVLLIAGGFLIIDPNILKSKNRQQ